MPESSGAGAMKSRIGLLAVVAGALLAAPVRADSADDQAIRSIQSSLAEAFNAKNIDGIMKVYAPGDTLVVFDVMPPRQFNGAAEYRKNLQSLFAFLKGPIKFSISDLVILTDGDVSYSRSIQHINSTDPNGDPYSLIVRLTDVYRKINDKWLIIHEHASVPVNLQNEKPDLLSKP